MKTEEIKAALKAKGLTYSMIAEASDLTVPYISSVITRHNTSLPVAEIIAKIIDKPVNDVFPELFIKAQQRQQMVDDLRLRLAS